MSWYDNDWNYRRTHTIQGESSAIETDIVIPLIVHRGTGTNSQKNVYLNNKCKEDFGDIRFTRTTNVVLDYFLEVLNENKALFWVKIPSVPANLSTVDIYMYYGNENVSTTSTTNTFVSFEGFEGSSHIFNTGSMTNTKVEDGFTGDYSLRTNESSDAHRTIWQNSTDYDLRDYIIECAVKWPTNIGNNRDLVGGLHVCGQNSGNNGYQIIIDPRRSDSPQIRRDTNYGGRTNGNFSAVVNTWYLLRTYMNDTNTLKAELWSEFNETLHYTTTRTSNLGYETGRHGLYSFTRDNNRFDNIRVRKKPEVTPSSLTWSVEETNEAEEVVGPFPTFRRQ